MCNCELNKQLEEKIEQNKALLNRLADEFLEKQKEYTEELGILVNQAQAAKEFFDSINSSAETLITNIELHQKKKIAGKILGLIDKV